MSHLNPEQKAWSCQNTDRNFAVYREGRLEAEAATALFQHVMGCPRCRTLYWKPFFEAACGAAEDVARELAALVDQDEQLPERAASAQAAGPSAANVAQRAAGIPTTGHSAADRARDDESINELSSAGTWCYQSSNDALFRDQTEDSPGGQVSPDPAAFSDADRYAIEVSQIHGPRLELAGSLLRPVPEPGLLEGYELYLNAQGDMQPASGEPKPAWGRLTVLRDPGEPSRWHIRLDALVNGVHLDNRPVPCGESRSLRFYHVIRQGETLFHFEAQSDLRAWLGILHHRGPAYPIGEGETLVGRHQDSCRIPLRDRRVRSNLRWNPEALARLAEQGQPPPFPGLYLDALKTGRQHVRLEREGQVTRAYALRQEFYVRYARENRWCEVRPESPGLLLEPGVRLVIGQQVFLYRID